jgi:vitamin B12 transporter
MRDSISWQNDISLRDEDLLTVGADYLHDRVDSSTPFDKTSRENIGYFAQYQTRLSKHDLILAARQDDNSQFGSQTTGNLSWGYPLTKRYRLVASVANAFKAPSFNDLYFPGFGNANLNPETAITTEIGLRGKQSWGNWDITAYRTEFDDLIAFDGSTSAPANLESARLVGLESQLQTRILKWDVSANLSFLKTENKTPGSNQGNAFPRRPEHALNIDIDRDYGRYSIGLSLLAKGKAYDDVANTRELDAYTLVDLRAAYQLNKEWLLQGQINNLFEEDYETAAFYNQPKSDVSLTLRYQPSNH